MDKYLYHPLTIIVALAAAAFVVTGGSPEATITTAIVGLVAWLLFNAVRHWRGG